MQFPLSIRPKVRVKNILIAISMPVKLIFYDIQNCITFFSHCQVRIIDIELRYKNLLNFDRILFVNVVDDTKFRRLTKSFWVCVLAGKTSYRWYVVDGVCEGRSLTTSRKIREKSYGVNSWNSYLLIWPRKFKICKIRGFNIWNLKQKSFLKSNNLRYKSC